MRLIGDRSVVGNPVQLRRFGLAVVRNFGDAQLNLVRLGLFGEDGSQRLRVPVGQLPSGHVAAIVGVAAGVGELNSAATQIVELVELAGGGEADPVVQFADLLQRSRRVLRNEEHTTGKDQRDDAAASRNTLARELASLPHRLLGRDEVRETHESLPARSASGPKVSARERLSMTSRASSAMRGSATLDGPSAPIVTAGGEIPRPCSGPPVAESSSAASYSASTATRSAESASVTCEYNFLIDDFANIDPEPTDW